MDSKSLDEKHHGGVFEEGKPEDSQDVVSISSKEERRVLWKLDLMYVFFVLPKGLSYSEFPRKAILKDNSTDFFLFSAFAICYSFSINPPSITRPRSVSFKTWYVLDPKIDLHSD